MVSSPPPCFHNPLNIMALPTIVWEKAEDQDRPDEIESQFEALLVPKPTSNLLYALNTGILGFQHTVVGLEPDRV